MPVPVYSDDSQKENAPATRNGVKKERTMNGNNATTKVKNENAKGGKGGKKRVESSEEPEDTRSNGQEGSPRGAKRSRVNAEGDSRATASVQDEDEETDERDAKEDPDKKFLVRDTDECVKHLQLSSGR
jgi:hypothetical protein